MVGGRERKRDRGGEGRDGAAILTKTTNGGEREGGRRRKRMGKKKSQWNGGKGRDDGTDRLENESVGRG